MSHTTFEDAINHGFDYLGGTSSDQALRDCKRAALEAYRELTNAANWSYLYTHGRIITSPAISGGVDITEDAGINNIPAATIQYQADGGTYPRQVTVSGMVWPDWAAEGTYIRVGQVNFMVDQRKSATVVTIDRQVKPECDLPPGTPFTLYRDTYLLPRDYIAQDQALFERNFGGMDYTHPREWLYENRYVFAQGIPQFYTITGFPKYPGRLVMRIFPWPYEEKTIDYIYKRSPRPLRIYVESAGQIATTSGSNTLTGTGTTFTEDMIGSVVRLANNGLRLPTGEVGKYPAAFESLVIGWDSATSIQTLDAPSQAMSGLAYTISDRVDIEEGAMLNAYLRCTEKHLGMVRTLKDKPSASRQYDDELSRAKAADSRSMAGRVAGHNLPLRRRLRDYPYTNRIE